MVVDVEVIVVGSWLFVVIVGCLLHGCSLFVVGCWL